jgi:gamma-glutamyltranspeptidase/glutathione hydrolase
MMTSMCPSLLCDAAGRWMAVGSAGSARIRSAILQIILQVVDCGATLKEAIGRPRIHAEGDTLYVEGFGRSKADVEALRPYGRDLVATWAAGFFFGGAQAVAETTEGFAAAAETVRRSCAAFVA